MNRKKIDFEGNLRQSLHSVGQRAARGYVVEKAREARLVVTPELRDVVKELARRQKQSMATVVWVAIEMLWFGIGYSRKDFNALVVEPKVKKAMKHFSRERMQAALQKLEEFDASGEVNFESEEAQAFLGEMLELGFFTEFRDFLAK